MRIRSAALPFATIVLATPFSSSLGAQANPNRPRVEAYTNSSRNGTPPAPACPSLQEVGATAASSVTATATCAPGAPYTGGDNSLSSYAAISNGLLSTSASVIGTMNPATDLQAHGLAYTWNFYTISDPTSVFRIVLATTVNSAAAATANNQDYSYALGYLGAYTVNPLNGSQQTSLSQQQRQSGAGGYASYQNVTSGCTRAGVCTNTVTASNTISTDLLGSDLNSNGIFAAFLEAYAFDRSYDNSGSPISVNDASYAYFDVPTVTLFDVNGNDVTSEHTITQDLAAPVVATPEPATVVFLGTGLISVFGVARRRRSMK